MPRGGEPVTENRTVAERPGAHAVADQQQRDHGVRRPPRYELPSVLARRSSAIRGPTITGADRRGTYDTSRARPELGNLFFNGNLSDIAKENPEVALLPDGTFDPTKTWFNIDAGFVKATADQPATFQKRTFPFRVDGVRGQSLQFVNANIARTFGLGGRRSFNFRVDIRTCSTGATQPEPGSDEHEFRSGPRRDPAGQRSSRST
jgi:hypothetical protein